MFDTKTGINIQHCFKDYPEVIILSNDSYASALYAISLSDTRTCK